MKPDKTYTIQTNTPYNKEEFKIEKQITVQESKLMKDLSVKNIYCYILHNEKHNYRFAYITSKHIQINTIINGESLLFIKTDLANTIKINRNIDELKQEIIKIDMNGSISFTPKQIFYTQKIFNKNGKIETIYKNDNIIHEKKICFDREKWFLKELRKIGKISHSKKIIKNILVGAKIDKQIEMLLKTQFFLLPSNEYMHKNTHSIILTNGGTGKSSILGIMGKNLNETSNAGIYGYYNVKTSSWQSGIVNKTKNTILVDECNELISKNDGKILDTLNTPLENGVYSYGKAGSRDIEFSNQFIFLGNISIEFNFDRFITGLSLNPLTIGRRFAFIVYNDKLEMVNGGMRPNKLNKHAIIFKHTISYFLDYILKIRKVEEKMFNNKNLNDKIKKFKKEQMQKIKEIEHENTKHFIKSYISHSIDNRLKMFALQISIFNKFDEIFNNGLKNFLYTKLSIEFYSQFDKVIGYVGQNIDNIINHLKDVETKNYTIDNHIIQFLKNSKYMKNAILVLCKSKFKNNKLNKNDISNKNRNFDYFCKDIKKYGASKYNQKFSIYGIGIMMNNDDIVFFINNKFLFNKTIEMCNIMNSNN